MTRFIIHAGYGKTGTTALQTFLRDSRSKLAQHGILYPDFRHFGIPLDVNDHNNLAYALGGQFNWLKWPAEKYFAQIDAQLSNQPSLNTVLLSGETFMGAPQPHIFTDEAAYWEAYQSKINKLKSLIGNRPASIVIYVRRQDDWVDASLNQTIKFYGLSRCPPETSVDGYIKAVAPRLDYFRQANLWAQIFGKETVQVRIYDRQLLKENDVIADFVHHLNLPSSLLSARRELGASEANDRLTRDLAEVKHILNRITRPKEHERTLGVTLRQISADMRRQGSHGDYALLSDEQRRSITQTYLESNRMLVEQFLGADAQALQVMSSAPKEKPDYQGLKIEKAMEIMHRLKDSEQQVRRHNKIRGTLVALRKRYPFFHAMLRFVQHCKLACFRKLN